MNNLHVFWKYQNDMEKILDRVKHWRTNGSHLNFLEFTWKYGEIWRRFWNTLEDITPIFWNNAIRAFCAELEQYCGEILLFYM